jgi:hypothetical protein
VGLDVALVEAATRQHGIVSRRQLTAIGFSAGAIVRRIEAQRLHPVHRGVYAVGHPLLMRYARYMAAVLACGERAVLSHRSAAALWGLCPPPSGRIDVTIPRGGSRNRRGVAVHTTRRLAADEATACEGVPCTTLARTLLDLAAVTQWRELRRALEQASYLGLFDRVALDAALGRARGRRGTGRMRRLLAELVDEPPLVRDELERRFLDLLHTASLPHPVVNGLLAGHQVDFHWPAKRLVVETDGRAAHDHAVAFERDRRRDLDLELAGWHVVRVTWRQVVNEPRRVAAMLRARLQAEPAGPARRTVHETASRRRGRRRP